MKTKTVAAPVAANPNRVDMKVLGPCVVAALVWLMLSLYMYYVVPAQLDIHDQILKPGQMRASLSVPLRVAVSFYEAHGTLIVSLLGFLGCGLAYIRRNVRLANWMIALGAVFLGALIYAVLSNVAKI